MRPFYAVAEITGASAIKLHLKPTVNRTDATEAFQRLAFGDQTGRVGKGAYVSLVTLTPMRSHRASTATPTKPPVAIDSTPAPQA